MHINKRACIKKTSKIGPAEIHDSMEIKCLIFTMYNYGQGILNI